MTAISAVVVVSLTEREKLDDKSGADPSNGLSRLPYMPSSQRANCVASSVLSGLLICATSHTSLHHRKLYPVCDELYLRLSGV